MLVKEIGMMVSRRARVTYGRQSMDEVDLQGVTDNIPGINYVQVDLGRAITYEEVRRHAPVTFIGNDVRVKFFEGKDPLGKTVDIEGRPGTDHLFIADQKGTRYIDCSKEPVSYFRNFVADVRDRTETAMTQAHVFTVCRLALDAQAKATRIGFA